MHFTKLTCLRCIKTLMSKKQALLNLKPEQLTTIVNGYSDHWIKADYGKVKRRWLLVKGEQATKRKEATFYKNLDKKLTKEPKALILLTKKPFTCEIDAQKAIDEFACGCQLRGFEQTTIVEEPIYSGIVDVRKKTPNQRVIIALSKYRPLLS